MSIASDKLGAMMMKEDELIKQRDEAIARADKAVLDVKWVLAEYHAQLERAERLQKERDDALEKIEKINAICGFFEKLRESK